MNNTELSQLKCISDNLALPPYNKKLSIYDLHDKLEFTDLAQLVWDVSCNILSSNNSEIKYTNIKNEDIDLIVKKMSEFLSMLGYLEVEVFVCSFELRSKQPALDVLYYLLSNIESHNKRAYLSNYLMPVSIPEEFMYQDGSQYFRSSDIRSYSTLRSIIFTSR